MMTEVKFSLKKCPESEKCFFLQVCRYFRKHYTQSSKGDLQMNVRNLLIISKTSFFSEFLKQVRQLGET